MYDININFLKDRKLDTQTQGGTLFRKKKATPLTEKLPMLIGGGIAVGLIALVVGGFFLLNNQKTNTKQAIAQLDAEIQRLQGQSSQVKQIESEIDVVNQEIEILMSVFNRIKPWSALLAEIGAMTPANVQIESIVQTDNRDLTITGMADSYENVNDFLLSLRDSPLLRSSRTKLANSKWTDNPNDVDDNGKDIDVSLPEVVEFEIITEITRDPSPEFINLLNRRGAIGLVTRLNTLKRKGALDIE